MKQRPLIILAFCGVLLAAALWIPQANAQIQGEWSQPYQLSTGRGKASEASLVADVYGYVHAFWSELLDDQSSVLYYARFDGGGWTTPLDLYKSRPFTPIQGVSPAIDQQGILHVIWASTDNGPLYYIHAPAANTLSAQHWQEPQVIDIPGKQVRLLIDTAGVMHLLYSRTLGETRGVYYTRSEDMTATWSTPIWLDPDIPLGYMAGSMQFKMDENGGLHALWAYVGFSVPGGDWVRYAHSLDGGATWSLPFTIDKVVEGADYMLSSASPVMALSGETVHVVWAGGSLHYRNHRISTDSGRTWSLARRILGELNGQAFEGLTTDNNGRVHYLGQIRYPKAIYHAIWDGERWSRPTIVYLLGLTATDPLGDRVHAHYTLSTIRGGNQLLLTFTDSPPEPERRLFAVYRTLEDLAPITPVPTPTPTATPQVTPTPTPTAMITPTAMATVPPATIQAIAALPPNDAGRPDQAIWSSMILPLVLLTGTAAAWLLNRHRKETAR